MGAIELSKETFQKEVLDVTGTVIVDFWAPWCGPCQALLPQVEELAGEVTGVKVCKLNVENEKTLARKYRVLTIPTLIKFENGEVVQTLINPESKEVIKEKFEIK